MIAPIGPEGSETRRRSDFVLERIIRPALRREPLDYAATRGDAISEMGRITAQVLRRVVHDPLVVADLTCGNPNVFYELAFRHILGRPVIQIQDREDENEYHNVRGVRTIAVDHRSADGVREAIEKIHAQALSGEAAGGPIDTGLRLEEKDLADVLARIPDLLRPEMAEGPDAQDLDSLRREVKKIGSRIRALQSGLKSDSPDLDRVRKQAKKARRRLGDLESDLENMVEFYGVRRPPE